MITKLSDLLSNPAIAEIIIDALIVGTLVSVCSALLGVSLVLKRYSMIGDGLSHVGYGALAIASAFGLSAGYTLEIAIPIVIIAAFFILKLGENSHINSDAAVAVISTGALAIGAVVFSLSGGTAADACSSLFGSASLITISNKDLIISLVLSAFTIGLYIVCYNRIFAVTFDENFSKATGIKVNLYNILIALLTAITIVVGMSLIGAILISGLIIFPPLSAMRLRSTFKSVAILSVIISIVCFILGFFAAIIFNLQIGPSVIIANLIFYIISVVIDKFIKRTN